MLTTPLYLAIAMPETPSPSKKSHIHVVQQSDSTDQSAVVLDEYLSPEDKMVLYAVLQDIARELRRLSREQKEH